MAPRQVVVVACAALALAAACKKKREPAPAPVVPIAALAAIPADAQVVVGIDVRRLADSRLVARAVDQMLVRDPELAARLERLARDCGVDVTRQVRSIHLALGPRPAQGTPGGPPSLLVATGELTEPALTRCLQAGVGAGGGDLSVKDLDGRSLYKLTEGRRTLYFAFGQADTVVIGPSEPWVRAAVAPGAKVEASPVLGPLLSKVERTAAMWTVAAMDAELGASLAKITGGKVAAPPRALYGALDPTDGLRAQIAFAMGNEGDAEALVGFARSELALGALAAQSLGLGTVVARIVVEQKGAEAQVRAELTDAELKQVLAAIDRGRPTGQDAQPAPDAGVPSPQGPQQP